MNDILACILFFLMFDLLLIGSELSVLDELKAMTKELENEKNKTENE